MTIIHTERVERNMYVGEDRRTIILIVYCSGNKESIFNYSL